MSFNHIQSGEFGAPSSVAKAVLKLWRLGEVGGGRA